MGFLRFCLIVLVLLAATLKVTTAQAANTLTLGTISWQDSESRNGRSTKQINRDDCVTNRTLQIGYTYMGSSGYAFELWTGASCDQAGARTGSGTTRTCVQVAKGSLTDRTITIKAADLVKDLSVTTFPAATADACNPASAVSGPVNRTLFLVVYDTGNMMPVVSQQWQYSYDIVGPSAPTGLTASAGDTTLITSFTGTKDTDVQSYRFFCAPAETAPANTGGTAGSAGTDAGGTAGTADMAAAGAATAGTDTGGTAGSSGSGGTSGTAGSSGSAGTSGTAGTSTATIDDDCYAAALIPNKPPDSTAMACGTVGAQGSKGGETEPDLTNDIKWAVAVASVDQLGNVGPLSNTACALPKDTVGFYEAYRNAGGQAGGGFCSFAPSSRGSLFTLLGLFGFGALAIWRRRR